MFFRKKKKWLIVGTMVCGLWYWGWSLAQDTSSIETQVKHYLMERHPQNPAQFWMQFEPKQLAPVMLQLFEKDTHIYHRTRLVQGMGFVKTEAVLSFLKNLAQDKNNEFILKRSAVQSFVALEKERSLSFLKPFLSDPNPHMRYFAALSLKQLAKKNVRARNRFQEFLKTEKISWVRQHLLRQVTQSFSIKKVSSSDAFLSKKWVGAWSGFVLFPDKKGKTLFQAKVDLKLKKVSRAVLEGKFEMHFFKKKSLLLNLVGFRFVRKNLIEGTWEKKKSMGKNHTFSFLKKTFQKITLEFQKKSKQYFLFGTWLNTPVIFYVLKN